MDRRKRAIDAYRRVRDGDPDTVATPEHADGFEKTGRPASDRPAGPGNERSASETSDTEKTDGTGGTARGDATGGTNETGTVPASRLASLLKGSGREKAARLLLALGTERAAGVLRQLDESEVEAIAATIVETRDIGRHELDDALSEAADAPVDRAVRGGPEVARRMLVAAFGSEEGERVFFRSVPNAPSHHFAFLNDLEAGQLHAAVKDEPDAAVALLIAHVDRPLAARVIAMLPEERRAAVMRRIGRMGKLSRDVVVRVEEALREKIRTQGRPVSERVDGPETLAAILRHMSPSAEDTILADLREANVDLSESIRKKLYTTDLLVELSDRHLADLLREFSDSEIALFLKGKDEALRARVLRAVSERRAQAISEEYAHLGAMRRDEVDRVTAEVLERMRELEEDGSILVPRKGDHYI
ncbi:MAG: flagellar motor switch protein FliG [Spirochaetota bacterium]